MVDITKIDAFIQSSPHPAWLATTQGHCVYANPALERLAGFTSDQINQADWRSLPLDEDRAVPSASWQMSLATGTPYRVQVRSQPLGRFRVRGSQLCWLLLLLVVTFNQWPSLFGQTAPSARLHVNHNSWTFNEGAPADVMCLAQANDGFLWLGGPNGLFRFDGTRFEPFRSPFGDRLLSTNLYSLFGPPSGGLWVGYVIGGFSFLDNGRVTNYASETGSVNGFAQDREGIVWAATSSGLWRFDHLGWQHIGVQWDAPGGAVTKVGFDPKGILWALAGSFGAPMDLIYLLPGTRHFKTAERNLSASRFLLDADRAVMTNPAAPQISDSSEGSEKKPAAYPVLTKGSDQFLDRNNSLWMSYDDKPGVTRLPKGRLRSALNRASPAGFETYDINPFQMAQLVDREGNIWFGDVKGIHRFSYSPLNEQEFPKEAFGNMDFAVAADDNGAVWISSHANFSKGDLDYVSGGKAQRRLPLVISSFAYRAPDRTFWFSGIGCLWHLVGHDFVRVNLPRERANQFFFLQTITQDRQGGIWVSFGHGLYRLADGSWTPYGGRDDLPKTGILIIEFTDSLGRVWFGYSKNQLAVLDGDRVRVFGPSDGLQLGNITAIQGRGSEIWIGGEFGLEQFDQGRFRNIAAVNDEWLRGISGIVETPNGDLWLNAISGIFHVRKAEISEALRDSNYRVKGEHFGRREGLPGIAPQVHPLPTAIEGTDGRLWFTLRNGVVWLDPAAYSGKKAASPPITIQSVAADDKSYAPASRLSLPAHTSSVQVSYSAVSLSDPEAIRFRYKLRETDKDWHEAVAATPVTYRNLPPGSYHFSVEASDTNGDWSGTPHNMAFTILPAFYQTVWFRFLGVIFFWVVLTGIYQLRRRQLARQYGMRERLLQLEADLAHTNRVSTLGEMAASLAHEIKQPIAAAITSANSCIEWLAHEPPNLDRARAAAARIDKYGNRAAEIIDRIRSLYKKSPPQRESVNVNGIIHEMLTLLKGEANRYSVAMCTELAADLPRIMVDRVQLQQVFMNLMLNAIEAMNDSGGEVTVKSELQGGQLQFSVSDTGVGLPMEKMDRIFSAFFTTKPQGSGMGLAISRSIVESHGGQLWASANSGGGATFHFTLPIQVTESSPLVA
jgi:signal transduction histidine kinase/ligand-binding sensor domain-containing protein